MTSFVLDDHFAAFVEDRVAEGRYASPTDVVQAGLRLLEERGTKLAALHDALVEGEESRPAEPFDFDDFTARKRGAGDAVG